MCVPRMMLVMLVIGVSRRDNFQRGGKRNASIDPHPAKIKLIIYRLLALHEGF